MKHKILWIGYGNFAERLAARVSAHSDTDILAYFHPDRTKAIQRFGSKAEWNLEGSLNDPEIDIVFITTPNDRHAEYIKAALSHRKHIFVEKPITAAMADALELLPQLRNNKNIFMVGHNMRRKKEIRKIKSIISGGIIGDVVSVYTNSSKGVAFDLDGKNWRSDITRHREGPLITVGIHLIDVLHYLMGPVDSVSAVIKNISRKTEAPDSNAILLKFESGATAFLEANYNTPSEELICVYGTEGSIYLNRNSLHLRTGRDKNRIPSDPVPVVIAGNTNTLEEELNEFFSAVERGTAVETGYQEALNALAVVEACFQSCQKQIWIEIKSITNEYFPLQHLH